jgi:hypothetical protein
LGDLGFLGVFYYISMFFKLGGPWYWTIQRFGFGVHQGPWSSPMVFAGSGEEGVVDCSCDRNPYDAFCAPSVTRSLPKSVNAIYEPRSEPYILLLECRWHPDHDLLEFLQFLFLQLQAHFSSWRDEFNVLPKILLVWMIDSLHIERNLTPRFKYFLFRVFNTSMRFYIRDNDH